MKPQSPIQFVVQPGGKLVGEVRIPGDKSISHRAIMLGSIAQGTTEVTGLLDGEDCLATLDAFKSMGVKVEGPAKGRLVIHGRGPAHLKVPSNSIYLGNSGTSMRLLTGLLAGLNIEATLTGDISLSSRPMQRVIGPISKMGGEIKSQEGDTPPLTILSSTSLSGIDYELPIASAQVKSAVLLAGLFAKGETRVTEPTPTRDHTERMLQGFGVPVQREGQVITIKGGAGNTLKGQKIDVPGDISSAAFFLVGAAISPGSELLLKHVGVNPTRTGVIDILQLMGADITLHSERTIGGEPVADIRIKGSPLQGVAIPERYVASAIDEFPALFIAAACAEGTTTLTGAKELRVKESDRIQSMANGLKILGVEAEPTPDGMIINGGEIKGGTVESVHDHRIAMAFSIAALRAKSEIIINGCNNVRTSFPGFIQSAQQAGLRILEN